MEDVYSYTNYRDLIKDYYEEQKKAKSSFSYQVFARKAGFTTKTYLIEVVSGKKPLSKGSIFNLARAMKLKKKETDYFEALVCFNNAKSIKEREFYFDRLKSLAGKSPASRLTSDKFTYFSQWYHVAIRELITMDRFNGDLSQLTKMLRPRITLKQVKDSVKLLIELGLIEKRASGKYRQTSASLSTGKETKSFAISKFQMKNLEMASDALDKVPVKVRDISSITAGISEECFKTIKDELALFRDHLQKLIEEDQGQDRVYQINFQLFPISDLPKKE